MEKKKVLIVGATGMVGRKIVSSFANHGHQVKILTRNKKKAQEKVGQGHEFFEGDVLNPKSLIGLFKEIDGVYLYLNDHNDETIRQTIVEGTKNIIELAKFNKINRIIFQSASTVNIKNTWFPFTEAQLEAESIVRNSGLDFSIVKPGYFMEALKFFLRGNQASVIGEGKLKYNWVAGNEFADKIVDIFVGQKLLGKTTYLFGPEALTLEEALKRYCAVVKPGAKFITLSHSMMHSISMFSNNSEMRFIADYIKFMDSASDNLDEVKKRKTNDVVFLNFTIEKWLDRQYKTP